MYGGPRARQHVIEFIPGTGMITDGAIDPTSINGPWTWTVPDNFLGDLVIDCVAGGGGGAGGGLASAVISCGGGGGGGAFGVFGYSLMSVLPNEAITITAGAGGGGGAVGSAGSNGGVSSVLAPGASVSNGSSHRAIVASIALALETVAVAGATSASTNGQGGAGQGSSSGNNNFPPPAGGTSGQGNSAGIYQNLTSFGALVSAPGAGGGAGAALGVTAGNKGGAFTGGFSNVSFAYLVSGFSVIVPAQSTGNASGGVSYAGGGAGASLPGLPGGAGGNGNAAGASAVLGGGGGGGGGNGAGGNGGAGYVRIMYLAVD